MAAKLAEKLLQVRQRYLLALADGREGDWAIVLAQGQINHGGDRKTAFGCETHRKLLVLRLVRCRNRLHLLLVSKAPSPPLTPNSRLPRSPSSLGCFLEYFVRV
jgi:hypothetical protein